MVRWPFQRVAQSPEEEASQRTSSREGVVSESNSPPLSVEARVRVFLEDVQWKQVGVLFLIFVVVQFLWDTPVVYPLKILVVFFHESSHGIVAVVTGGSIDHIEVNPDQGGVCYTIGGNRFLTLSAGYLGSLIWGGVILTLASRTMWDRYISIVLGGVTIAIDLAYVRPILFSFGSFFGLAAGIGLCATGYKLPREINEFLLKIIGLTSCLYATLDIKEDVLDRPGVRSDAAMLAEITAVPTLVWGLLWITIAMVASLFFVLLACKERVYGNDDLPPCPDALQLPPPMMALPQQLEGFL